MEAEVLSQIINNYLSVSETSDGSKAGGAMASWGGLTLALVTILLWCVSKEGTTLSEVHARTQSPVLHVLASQRGK